MARLICAVVVLAQCFAQPGAFPPLPPAERLGERQGASPDPHEIAHRVLSRLRETPFLSLDVEIHADKEVLHAHSLMGENRLRTDVFRDSKCILSLSLVEGRVQEYVPVASIDPDFPAKNVTLEYDADTRVVGVTRPLLVDANEACAFVN